MIQISSKLPLCELFIQKMNTLSLYTGFVAFFLSVNLPNEI